jgi:hypothetical protein
MKSETVQETAKAIKKNVNTRHSRFGGAIKVIMPVSLITIKESVGLILIEYIFSKGWSRLEYF